MLLGWIATFSLAPPARAQSDIFIDIPGGPDKPKPTPTPCPALNIKCPSDIVCWKPGVALGRPTGTGGCGATRITYWRSDGKYLNDKFPNGQTTVTWYLKDSKGNQVTCQQTVTVVPDQNVSEATFSLGALDKILDMVRQVLNDLKINKVTIPKFQGQLKISKSLECCPAKPGVMTEKSKISGSLSTGLWDSGRIVLNLPPWSGDYTLTIMGRKIGVEYGVFIQFKGSVNINASRQCEVCTGTSCWTVGGGGDASITGGLLGNLPNPGLSSCGPNNDQPCSVLRIEAPINTGFGVGVEAGCETLKGSVQWSGLTAGLTVTLFEGTWFEAQAGGNLTLFQPQSWETPPIALPKVAAGTCSDPTG